MREDVVFLYGFSASEEDRVSRRIGAMQKMGYETDYPLVTWDHSILEIEEIGIKRPITYDTYKHANCVGCIKAGKRHWYITYCLHNEVFEKAKLAEEVLGHSILTGEFLEDVEELFAKMKELGVAPNEKVHHNAFWAEAYRLIKADTPLGRAEKNAQFTVSKNDKILAVGTLQQIAKQLNVSVSTVRFYGAPSYIERANSKKNMRGGFRRLRRVD